MLLIGDCRVFQFFQRCNERSHVFDGLKRQLCLTLVLCAGFVSDAAAQETGEDLGQNTPTLLLLPIDELEEEQVNASLQGELNRLGCQAGKADGKWGRKSDAALGRLIKEKPELEGLEPSTTLLEMLQTYPPNLCPLVCSAREVKVGNSCQLKTCAAGQYLDSKGKCRTRQATVKKPKTQGKPAKPVRKKKCVSYNGRTYCS